MMKRFANQLSVFDVIGYSDFEKLTDSKSYKKESITLADETLTRLKNYRQEDYTADIESEGLEATWDNICQFLIDTKGTGNSFFDLDCLGALYEMGLAIQDKHSKKDSGQYYTPEDVSKVMCEWLSRCEGAAVCDVGCGTGNLILTYLDFIGYEAARKLISDGNLYLYDLDNVALKICRTIIGLKYGLDIIDAINDIYCDFLDRSVSLPNDCKVISNPPYAKIEEIQDYWKVSDVVIDTRELYSSFMDKIFREARAAVIITPFSFISGNKFLSLRKEMCEIGTGFIVSFDNIPGNIFCGRKQGIFNTNTANSVRAAITVFLTDRKSKGFRVSPLIRFKNEEREKLLTCKELEKTVNGEKQIVDVHNTMFGKIEKDLYEVFLAWRKKSDSKVIDFLSVYETDFFIDMPNTCRYYTSASGRKLRRAGSHSFYVKNKDEFSYIYCMLNSSFAYWWWRIYDGGITYPYGLLLNMPLFYNLLSVEDKQFFNNLADKLLSEESDYTATKLNAGNKQENIRFPKEYRDMINKKLLLLLGFEFDADVFEKVHSNRFFM